MTLTLGNGGVGHSTTVAVSEGTEIVDGAGNDAVGEALAAKINTNLGTINTAVNTGWGEGTLSHASYDANSDQLTFTFSTGSAVADNVISTAIGGATGTLAVSAPTVTTEGGTGGVDTFVFEDTAVHAAWIPSTTSTMGRIATAGCFGFPRDDGACSFRE